MNMHNAQSTPRRQSQTISAARRITRRTLLSGAGAAAAMSLARRLAPAAETAGKRPKVAAVITSFFHRSHAHVILENFLQPYLFNGKKTDPGVDVVAFYLDQFPSGDMARDTAKQFDIPIFKSIDQALCLGGRKLAVDAVLSIGEHGGYPTNSLGQVEYPRKRFWDAEMNVMQRSNRFVPIFNDKHLSYRWDWAKEMVDKSRQSGAALMAGSSVPLAQRRPNLELPAGAEIESAVSVHGGGFESYDFHGLEVMQSMLESRKGGESGVSRVEFLQGETLLKAEKQGLWSLELAQAAIEAELGEKPADLYHIGGGGRVEPHGILVHYKDGLKAMMLKLGNSGTRWNFACRLKGDSAPRATAFHVGPWNNRNLFKALSHAIQHHFIHGQAPYSVERTLMTTGVLEAAVRSRAAGKALATPHLEFAYTPRDFRAMREMGASWKIITDKTPQPMGITPVGLDG